VARNRKRPRERRPRQPGGPVDPHQGLPTVTHDSDNGAPEREDAVSEFERGDDAPELEPVDLGSDPLNSDPLKEHEKGAPPPLEHATPDAELAEEQLAYGRPAEAEPGDEADEEEYEREVEESIADSGGGRRGGGRGRGGGYDGGGGAGGSGGGELAAPGTTAVAERRPSLISRFIGFLQGSWRELQRVQWPDRRQVFQATGVVIGFVIVAAVFLGVSDWAAGKIVTFILK
jgi:preprotein translocase subunit SecE